MGAKSVPCCSVVQKGVSMASAAAWSFGHVGRGQPPLCASLATGSAVSALLYLLPALRWTELRVHGCCCCCCCCCMGLQHVGRGWPPLCVSLALKLLHLLPALQ
eukprot:1158441-Pelagomonas_calceolata.AAC.1